MFLFIYLYQQNTQTKKRKSENEEKSFIRSVTVVLETLFSQFLGLVGS